MRDTQERLRDILEGIERIESRMPATKATLDSDEMLQTWIVHHPQIIGEAARALPDSFRQSHPTVPWRQIIGMRHILVHDYFSIDTEIVWDVLQNDLMPLKRHLQEIMGENGSPGS